MLSAFFTEKVLAKHFLKKSVSKNTLFTEKVFLQKMKYIHNNPVKASICKKPADYKYSSAKFYDVGEDEFQLISPY
jgi:hypothetical protein